MVLKTHETVALDDVFETHHKSEASIITISLIFQRTWWSLKYKGLSCGFLGRVNISTATS